jgi:thioredoxin 1
MADKLTKEFNDTNFEAEVIKSDVPVLVDIWAEWCGPCRMLAPTIDALASEYDGKAKVGKLDADSNRDTVMKFGVSALPTILVFKGGQVVHKFIGLRQKAEFKQVLDSIAAK